jgi:hypothetical protein
MRSSTVLIAHDDPTVMTILKCTFRRQGAAVLTVRRS